MQKKIFFLFVVFIFFILNSHQAFSAPKKSLEERVKKLEASTITKDEATGHVFNYFKGFDFRFGVTSNFHGSFNNDDNSGKADSLDGSASLDFVLSKQIHNHGLGVVHLEAGVGNGLDNDLIFNSLLFGSVNADAGGTASRFEVAEASYEGNYFDGGFVFTLGRLDSTVFFDNSAVANDETTQFLNGGFRNNTTVEFPAYAFGLHVKGVPSKWFYISAGVFDAASTGYDIEANAFWIGEVGITPKLGELEGNYRIYGWGNHADHTDIYNGSTNDYGLGVGGSFDQQLTKWFTLFARAGYQSQSIYQNYLAFSGGLHVSGELYNRKTDWFGLAYGVAINNDDFAAGKNEHVVETFYRFSVAKGHVGLSPDVQFIVNPSGNTATTDSGSVSDYVVVAGIRAQVDF